MFHPRSARTSETNPFSNGMWVLMPGNPELNSAMVAIPLVVALRPVSSDARVGEHSAVVWKFEYFTPRSAIRRIVGVSIGPPKMSILPYPTSSQAMIRTFGAFSGAWAGRYGAQSGTESRMSTAIFPWWVLAMATLPISSRPVVLRHLERTDQPNHQTCKRHDPAKSHRMMSRIRQNMTTPPLRSRLSRNSDAARREGPDS